ncbi:hypothetical protein RHMOL_Rhmol05G0299400 [Rhododendron molle]|uniref:Uncharacterized protein n=1 Tax=Rhododendron molle TaxID=49168 RepID=A0ACC0NWM5_RHOML|nr:hypothetical protein RHMOL_Rhmol05G0299400 [Rhododendron molle]
MAGSQSTGARETFHLPLEIVTEILSRLPAKSLLRFKSVCKDWYDLIETPDFISKHFQTQSTNSTSLLVTKYDRETETHAMSLIFNDGFPSNGPINLDFPFLNSRRFALPSSECPSKNYFSIGGVCNGLVCVSLSPFGYPLILCNPATRQFRDIPNSECQWSGDTDYYGYVAVKRVSLGFGYHASANDYKLIRIVIYSNLMKDVFVQADLYVMRTDTWREIDADKFSAFLGETSYVQIGGSCASAVLNGVFYWPACVMPTNEVIVGSFDMGDEVFRRIQTPVCLDETWDEINWRITELKDKLALVIHLDDRRFDVWVLNEDQGSWTNQFKLGSFPRIAPYVGCGENGEITVVGGMKNGELLVTDHKVSGNLKLFSYDPKTRKTTDLYFGRVPYPSDIYLYTGTLVSIMETNEAMLNRKNKKRKQCICETDSGVSSGSECFLCSYLYQSW